MPLHGPSRPVKAARSILDDFGFQSPQEINLQMIAGDRRALIESKPMQMAEGRLAYRNGRGTISIAEDISLLQKERFVIAHEIGHIELHQDSEIRPICDEDAINEYREDKQPLEAAANEFAGELLMPEEMFVDACNGSPPRLELLDGLASTFRTSLTSSAIRYATIGPRPAAVVLVRGGNVQWFWPNPHFPHKYIDYYNEPPPRESGAGKILSRGEALEDVAVVKARTWFGDKAPRDQYFYESTHYSEQYGRILCTLWEYEPDI